MQFLTHRDPLVVALTNFVKENTEVSKSYQIVEDKLADEDERTEGAQGGADESNTSSEQFVVVAKPLDLGIGASTTSKELYSIHEVFFKNGKKAVASVLRPNIPDEVAESEVATVEFVRTNTTILLPRVDMRLRTEDVSVGTFILREKPPSEVTLDAIFEDLPSDNQDALIAQIAKWTVALSKHRFGFIGNLYADAASPSGYKIGPITRHQFYTDNRTTLSLNRGPFSSSKAYFQACVERERFCVNILALPQSDPNYEAFQHKKEHALRSMGILELLIAKCDGLEEDSDTQPFALDMHELTLKDFLVERNADGVATIAAVTGFNKLSTQPIRQCARIPAWLRSYDAMPAEHKDPKVRQRAIFVNVAKESAGPDSEFSKALMADVERKDARSSLHDLCDYNALDDAELLEFTLKTTAVTFPGHEDFDSLKALADPTTISGLIARISTATGGLSDSTMRLAFDSLYGKDQSQGSANKAANVNKDSANVPGAENPDMAPGNDGAGAGQHAIWYPGQAQASRLENSVASV